MVFTMVVLGGATRLTRSGLSIVEWKPQGSWLPSTTEEWEEEFEKYKQYPEYKRMNKGMALDEFKFIYFMEWFHRMWGRAIGVAFAVPLAIFAARGMIPRPLWGRLGLAFGLGGLQGGVGWWMVKSSPHTYVNAAMAYSQCFPFFHMHLLAAAYHGLCHLHDPGVDFLGYPEG
ncbi:COX15 [Symbiodinium sp. KB8]|nr:COX15 [Symbiodinium sp. KB8]